MTQPSSKQPVSAAHDARKGAVARGFIYGFGFLLVGVVVGLIAGANIGGNWMTDFSLGSQHGYEATALVGAIAGGIIGATTAFWLTVRRRSS